MVALRNKCHLSDHCELLGNHNSIAADFLLLVSVSKRQKEGAELSSMSLMVN